mgnify:CR=1 FL=1
MSELSLLFYQNKHKGEKFLVYGLGTSLDQFPPEFYAGFPGIVIGINEVIYPGLFYPDYLFDINLFHDKDYNAFFDREGNEITYRYADPSNKVYLMGEPYLPLVGTGAVPAIAAAYFMGASEIYLIGIDFNRGANGRIYHSACSKTDPAKYKLADKNEPEVQAALHCLSEMFLKYSEQGVRCYNLSQNSRLENIEVAEWPI